MKDVISCSFEVCIAKASFTFLPSLLLSKNLSPRDNGVSKRIVTFSRNKVSFDMKSLHHSTAIETIRTLGELSC